MIEALIFIALINISIVLINEFNYHFYFSFIAVVDFCFIFFYYLIYYRSVCCILIFEI